MSQALSQLPGPLVQVIYFFLALFPLVLVHELGHFVLAKWNKVRVDEFGIGFPPRLVKVFTHDGTDYTLNALPLGGFVRLAGEDDPDIPGAFASKSKRARAAVLFAGPLFNFLLAAVILSGVAWSTGAASVLPQGEGLVQILAVSPDDPADRAGLTGGDIVLAVDGQLLTELPVEGEPAEGESMGSMAFIQATDAHTDQEMALTLLRGVDPVAVDVSVDGLGTEPVSELSGLSQLHARRVVAPAGELEAGDLLLGPLSGSIEEPIVLRGQLEVVETSVVPELNAVEDRGMMGISIGSLTVVEPMGLAEAALFGPRQTMMLMVAMVDGIYRMITGQLAADIAGPVGIAKISQQAGEQGAATFFGFMALLSINLGIINLVPIPALDGGRLLFILFEALRGRRIEPTREAVVHLIGFVLVIGLMMVITVYELFGGAIRP